MRCVKRIVYKRNSYICIEDYLKKYLKKSASKTVILEVGLGTAPLTYLEYYGYSYIGVEPSYNIVRIFNQKGYRNIKQGFAENMDFVDKESVDAIICIGCLFSVINIRNVLFEFSRILKTTGIILLIDINADENVYDNISSYTNYAFSKNFLANSLKKYGYPLELSKDYFYLNDYKKIVQRSGSKIFAVLKKTS